VEAGRHQPLRLRSFPSVPNRPRTAIEDPVCGMELSEKNDFVSFKVKNYFFCCASCKWAFEKNPGQFLGDQQ
jgi:YHS domain-containing protein